TSTWSWAMTSWMVWYCIVSTSLVGTGFLNNPVWLRPPPPDRAAALGLAPPYLTFRAARLSEMIRGPEPSRREVAHGHARGAGRLRQVAGRGAGHRPQPLASGHRAGGDLRPWRRGGPPDPRRLRRPDGAGGHP